MIQETILGTTVIAGGTILALNKLGVIKLNGKKGKNECPHVAEHTMKLERIENIEQKHYGKIDSLEGIQTQQHLLIMQLKERTERDKKEADDRFCKGDETIENLTKSVGAIKTNIRLIAAAVKVPKEELEG